MKNKHCKINIAHLKNICSAQKKQKTNKAKCFKQKEFSIMHCNMIECKWNELRKIKYGGYLVHTDLHLPSKQANIKCRENKMHTSNKKLTSPSKIYWHYWTIWENPFDISWLYFVSLVEKYK